MTQHKGVSLLDVPVKDAVPPNIGVNLLGQDHLVDFIVGGRRSYRIRNFEAFALLNGLANIASIVVVGTNMLCNTLHCCYVVVCFLVFGAIEYESIQLRFVALELGEVLAWQRFEVLVSFCLRFFALAIASSLGFTRLVIGVLCHVGWFHLL